VATYLLWGRAPWWALTILVLAAVFCVLYALFWLLEGTGRVVREQFFIERKAQNILYLREKDAKTQKYSVPSAPNETEYVVKRKWGLCEPYHLVFVLWSNLNRYADGKVVTDENGVSWVMTSISAGSQWPSPGDFDPQTGSSAE
jgi:hypothetical protein